MTTTCPTCHGVGALIVTIDGRHEVERCDACRRFKDDRSAWRSLQPRNQQGRRK